MKCGGAGELGFNEHGPIECPRCEGRRIDPEPLTICPYEFVTPDAWSFLDLIEHARKGRWPLAGGLLDQTAVFREAAELVWGMESQYRARTPTLPDPA